MPSAPDAGPIGGHRTYAPGTRIWIPDPEVVWRKAEVLGYDDDDKGGKLKVHVEDFGTEVLVPANQPTHLCNVEVFSAGEGLTGLDDLTQLTHLHEAAVLDSLHLRFDVDKIYTFTGPILIAVNPFKSIEGLYAGEVVKAFLTGQERAAHPASIYKSPHVFAIGSTAYHGLCASKAPQTILISGESGAGKTESTKFVMKFLALAGSEDWTHRSQIENQVLQSNPLLETLGNAKTLRNNNSSRFGKFIEMQFSLVPKLGQEALAGRLVGARIHTYLLETVRVCRQSEGERNYHSFYQLCAAAAQAGADGRYRFPSVIADEAPEAKPCEFDLASFKSYDNFRYLTQSSCATLARVDDVKEFEYTILAMQTIGIPMDEQVDLLNLIGAVLYLGNVQFEPQEGNSEASRVRPDCYDSFARAAQLLRVNEDSLATALTVRSITARDETYAIPLKVNEAEELRDSLAKALYGTAFLKVVKRTNESIGYREDVDMFCGVLDIFGFECFDFNSFEQLCINFTNERLQQFFNTFVFKCEEKLYEAEKIPWNALDFPDNKDCVDLMEQRTIGIFAMLDEECMVPRGSDQGFCNKMKERHKENKRFGIIKTRAEWFIVNHFAGGVSYCVTGFLDKNRDQLSQDAQKCIVQSSSAFIRDLFETYLKRGRSENDAAKKQWLITVSYEFRNQLDYLMHTVAKTEPHFIRCIKPNQKNVPDEFERPGVTEQLRYGGVLQAVQVSRAGYPVRLPHRDALLEYGCLCDKTVLREQLEKITDMRERVTAMLQHLDTMYKFRPPAHAAHSWAVGETLVFLKHESYEVLSTARAALRERVAITIQSHWKGTCQRRFFLYLRASTIVIQTCVRGLVARRHAQGLREDKAARALQQLAMRFLHRCRYLKFRGEVIQIQAIVRAFLARRRVTQLRQERAAVRIQTTWRRYKHHTAYNRLRGGAIKAQLRWRQLRAKREVRRLRMEQRDAAALQVQNQRLADELQKLRETLAQENEGVAAELQRLQEALATSEARCTELETWKQRGEAAELRVTELMEECDTLRQEQQSLLPKEEEKLPERAAAVSAGGGRLATRQTMRIMVPAETVSLLPQESFNPIASDDAAHSMAIIRDHAVPALPEKASPSPGSTELGEDVIATRTPSPTRPEDEAGSVLPGRSQYTPSEDKASVSSDSCTYASPRRENHPRQQEEPGEEAEDDQHHLPVVDRTFQQPTAPPLSHVSRIPQLTRHRLRTVQQTPIPMGHVGVQAEFPDPMLDSSKRTPDIVVSARAVDIPSSSSLSLSHPKIDIDLLVLAAEAVIAAITRELAAASNGRSLPPNGCDAILRYAVNFKGSQLTIAHPCDGSPASVAAEWASRAPAVLIAYDVTNTSTYRNACNYMKMTTLHPRRACFGYNAGVQPPAVNMTEANAYLTRCNCPAIDGPSVLGAIDILFSSSNEGVLNDKRPPAAQATGTTARLVNGFPSLLMSRIQNYFGGGGSTALVSPGQAKAAGDTIGPVLYPSQHLHSSGRTGGSPRDGLTNDSVMTGGALVAVEELPDNTAAVTCVAFGGELQRRDFYLLAAACKDGSVIVYRVTRTARERHLFDECVAVTGDPMASNCSSSGASATGCRNRTVDVYLQLFGHSRAITQLLFSHNDEFLVTASVDKSVRFWSLETGDILKVFADSAFCVAMAFLPFNPSLLVVSNANAVLRVVDTRDGKVLQRLRPESEIRCVTFDEAGLNCITGSRNGVVHVLDIKDDGKLQFRLKTKVSKAALTCLTYVPARGGPGARPSLIVNACDSTISIVNCIHGQPNGALMGLVVLHRLKVAHSLLPLRSCYSSSGGGWIISASEDRLVYVYSLAPEAGYKCVLLRRHQAPVVTVAVNQANTILASADSCGKVILWRWGTTSHPAVKVQLQHALQQQPPQPPPQLQQQQQ